MEAPGAVAEDEAMVLEVLLWCVFGLIAGAIAQFQLPGKDPSRPVNVAITLVLGVVGAAGGGLLSSRVFGWDDMVGVAGGAALLLVLYRGLAAAGIGRSHSANWQ
jgi:uncharacterized membrane protein YeaQ/YmgE (transglycosylase-associated protein family)